MLRRKELTCDLLVVGGGMAGISAAVSAARSGAKVVLMHERPVLGGNASSEIRMWVCGAYGAENRETGLVEEIALENLYRNPTKNYYIWDTILYGLVENEPNVTLLLNCTCMDAKAEKGSFADGRDTKIELVTGYQMTTQTFIDVKAKFYADCSGDSILAPLVGAEFRIGREAASEFGEDTELEEADELTMGHSCLLYGRETTQKVDYKHPEWAGKIDEKYFEARGLNPFADYENYWYLELGGMKDTIHDTDEIQKELIPLALNAWDYVKNSGKFETENWELDFLGFLPGKRESRRMVGEYMITERDIATNRQFDDEIAYGGWPLDDHFPAGFYHKGTPNKNIDTPSAYSIPYRCLYSKNVENLFFAGRNISATHFAMSSTRVMSTCALLGEAVGAAAAIGAKYNLTPHGVYTDKLGLLQDMLLEKDCFLPRFKRKVSEDCVSENKSLSMGIDRIHSFYPEKELTKVKKGEALTYSFDSKKQVNSVHIVFDSDLGRESIDASWCEKIHITRANTRLDSPTMTMPKALCKAFKLEITKNGTTETIFETSENIKRYYHININDEVEKIALTPLSAWDEASDIGVISFDFN